MQDYEKLGAFYLGKRVDESTGKTVDDLLLYDSRDLTTHAVCVGMTGSGKTGLGVALLEEAAIDGVPAIVIDPKGDLGNLLLTFPALQPGDFRPWIEPAEAARRGVAPDALAAQTAEAWRKGLAEWGQDGTRIARYREAVDLAIYTPGSTAGLPLSILNSFSAPSAEVLQDAGALRERVTGSVSGLLALVGIDADPLRGREAILLANILDHAWRTGQSPDLPGLIQAVQKPPFDKVGVFDLETFFPSADRIGLAMALNNLLASPGFSAWLEGEPPDIQRLLYTPEGKPRVSVISIAHLSDAERMFVVTLLLNETIAWMRAQPGTSSLRALLYMDEIFGYFPPTAVPPSKPPMLTLLKQARAFGLGVVLCTQNPVDLDYKGLANAGTWFIGRLQTDRDKSRVLDGLESALSGGGGFDRARAEALLAGLGNRVFLMHDVHEDHPVLFQSRWALSYLRGPMTPAQIQTVMAGRKGAPAVRPATGASAPATQGVSGPAAGSGLTSKPAGPADVPEYFVRPAGPVVGWSYRAGAVGLSKMHFVDAKTGTDTWVSYVHVAPWAGAGGDIQWDRARTLAGGGAALERQAVPGAGFAAIPAAALRAANYADGAKTLKTYLYQNVTLDIQACPELKLASRPGESEGDFRARLGVLMREKRDLEVEALRRRYAPRLATLQEQLRRVQARVAAEKAQLGQQTLQTAISVGATILGALFGRKAFSVGNVGRAATAARGAGRAMRERGDIQRAMESVEAVQAQVDALQQEFEREAAGVQGRLDSATAELSRATLRPRKSDIAVSEVALVWLPCAAGADGAAEPLFG